MKKEESEELLKTLQEKYEYSKTTDGETLFRKVGDKNWHFIEDMEKAIVLEAQATMGTIINNREMEDIRSRILVALKHEIIKFIDEKPVVGGIRVITTKKTTYIDCVTHTVKINKEVVKMTEKTTKIAFRKTPLQKEMPPLAETGDIMTLRKILGMTKDAFFKLLFFMIASMMGKGPYPILLISGPEGAGKTTTAGMVKQLLDPDFSEITPCPKSTRDFNLLASQSKILSIDNMRAISTPMEDSLCVVSTGGGTKERTLYTNSGITSSLFRAILIFTSISKFTNRADLLSRILTIETSELKEIKEKQKLLEEYDQCLPELQRGLYNVIQSIHANQNVEPVKTVSRMADAVNFVSRAEPFLGLKAGFFAEKADQWHGEMKNDIASVSTLLNLISEVMDSMSQATKEPAEFVLKKKPTQMLEFLLNKASNNMRKDVEMPKNAATLGKKLEQLKSSFIAKGIIFESAHTGTCREISFSFTDERKKMIQENSAKHTAKKKPETTIDDMMPF